MSETCCDCRYWHDPGWEDKLGMCRRYPPTLVQVPGVEPTAEVATFQPETGVIARCGEFAMMDDPRRRA